MIALAWEGDFPVTQLFGETAPFYSSLGMLGHNGLDVGLPVGTRLRALYDGTVVEGAYDAPGYGHYLKLRTAEGWDLLYAHCAMPPLLAVGDQVAAGDFLAVSGSSGHSSGPHLHLGWRPSNEYRGGGYLGYADPLHVLWG